MNLALQTAQAEGCLDAMAEPSVIEALHCLRVAITIFDSDERIVFVNEHFNHLFCSMPPRAELIGLTYTDLIHLEISGGEIADPLLLADIDGFVASRRAQLLDGEIQPRDLALADGRVIEIKARRKPGGGWIAMWSDVTGARHVLGRLQSAIALSADAFAFFGRNDELVLCNDEYAEIHGARAPDDLIGQNFRNLVSRQALRGLVQFDDSADAWIERRLELHGVPAGAMTVEMASGDAYLMRDRATEDGGRVIVLTDITEHHRIEKALAEQTRTLDKTRRALAKSKAQSSRQATYLADLTQKLGQASAEVDSTKTTLLRTMSHELKTPLNAIIGFSDFLQSMADRIAPDQLREYAGLIHQGGKNLLRLINEILDLTKISAGRYELCPTTVDISLLLWGAKEAFAAPAQTKNIVIDAACCPLGLCANADENALTSIVHQLVENAVTFTQDGGTVRLSASRDGNTVRICVSDNGPGVAGEDLERILRPFEQGGRGTADHSAGTGLGLTLVKALCELHGGSLTVESAAGEGFTATVALSATM
ncbi:MAG: PAS-domain containing protein [Alphaproteobacteria bacterium]|nr:PAS-domain containing protein [Alphaproteobacteria bacterium]MDE2498736.1 PAS-domain containing protein [Alphaproteobacteria bacterium]